MPIVTRTLVRDDITPVRAYAALRAASPGRPTFLLESAVAGERWGRYSILGCRPRDVRVLELTADPLAGLADADADARAARSEPIAARFARARVGVFPYDLVHGIAKVPGFAEGLTRGRVVADATVLVFDHLAHTVHVAGHDADDLDFVESALGSPLTLSPLAVPDPAGTPDGLEVSIDDATYGRSVLRAKEYIAAGDAFQIVLARTFSAPRANRDPLDAYRALRILSPAPYMYLVELPGGGGEPPLAVAGASPETLVRLEDGVATLRPIAGTRPRGRTEEEDAALAKELAADPKEVAEHVMLIDLARNDIGRIAETGSVTLPRRMEIERFSHVMHIVSEVRGRVRAGVTPGDVLRSAFPAGTLTGAPKVRAMQIIRELEARPRGVYGGAVGYFTRSGDLDLAIAIRTIVFRGDRVEVTAGAGIVEASDPAMEALETRNKAKAALAALAGSLPRALSRRRVVGYLTYYIAWALASYALRSPWLLLGIVAFFLLRRWLPDPSVYLRTLGRIRGLESAREANPDNVTARRDLARLYLERGRPRKALVYVEEAQRRAPDDAELSYLHGVCLQRTGRHEEALRPLVRAVDLDPRLAFGEPYRWAAEALAALGRLDEAEDAWLRYLDVSSSSVDARVRLAGVLARSGRRKEAAERVDEAIRTHRELPGFAARKQLGARLSAEVARVTIKREPVAIVVALALSAIAGFVTMRAVDFVRTHDLGTGKRGHVAGRPLLPRPGVATDDEMDEPEEAIAEDMRPDPTQFRRVPPAELAQRGVTWAKQPTGSGLMGNVVAIQVLCGLVGTYGPADRDEDGQLVFAFLDTKTSTYWGVRLREGELVWGTPTALHETNPQADFRLFRRMMALSLVASAHGQSDGPPDCTLDYRKNGQPHRMGYRRGETFSEAVAASPSAASALPSASAAAPARSSPSPSGSAPTKAP